MSETAVILRVAGISYTNDPAGLRGDEYRAELKGDEADAVWYQVDRSIVREALFGEDIRKAYLSSEVRHSLADVGVVYESKEDVARCGMSNYILWLKQ
jgi:hypothetical protein